MAVNQGGIVQPGPRVNQMGPVNTGGIVQPQPPPQAMTGINSLGKDSPARNQVDPYLSGAKPKQPTVPAKSATSMTWKDFLSANMGAYMKSEGGHGAAIRKLAKEWKELKR